MFSLSFAHPWLLLLLILPILHLVWIWRRRSARVRLPFDYGSARAGWRLAALLHSAESLTGLLLIVVVVILAGPQRLSEPRTKRALTNIEFCVDVSGSMRAPFGERTRYDASMKAIDEFLVARDGDAFGLTFFGNSVLHWVPLTSDASALRCAPPFMRPEVAPPWMQGTEIGKALLACKEVLSKREEGDRMIVLVSDGDSFDLFNDNDLRVAATLKQNGITVYAIHISDTGIPGPITNITTLTGGAAFSPDDPAGLKSVFDRIDSMREARLEKTSAETLDDFRPYCVAGLVLLGLVLLSSYGLRYTPW